MYIFGAIHSLTLQHPWSTLVFSSDGIVLRHQIQPENSFSMENERVETTLDNYAQPKPVVQISHHLSHIECESSEHWLCLLQIDNQHLHTLTHSCTHTLTLKKTTIKYERRWPWSVFSWLLLTNCCSAHKTVRGVFNYYHWEWACAHEHKHKQWKKVRVVYPVTYFNIILLFFIFIS